MSHFSVLVIGPDPEEQLAPYDENIEVAPYFRPLNLGLGSWYRTRVDEAGIDPADAEAVCQFLNKDEGTAEYLVQDGVVGRMSAYNPQSKWDWHQLGGRFRGFFRLKPNCEGNLGEAGVFDNEPQEDSGVDACTLGCVDWEPMRTGARQEAEQAFDVLERVTAGIQPPVEGWDSLRERRLAEGKDIEQVRKEYADHPWVKAVREEEDLYIPWMEDPWAYFQMDKPNPREAFVNLEVQAAGVPYATVMDGRWYQRGEMGWWGISTEEMDYLEWCEKFWALINGLPPDTQLALFDCHI